MEDDWTALELIGLFYMDIGSLLYRGIKESKLMGDNWTPLEPPVLKGAGTVGNSNIFFLEINFSLLLPTVPAPGH